MLKDYYLGKAEKQYGLVEYYQEFNERIEKLPNQFSKALVGKYKNNLQRIKDFLASRRQKDILIKGLTNNLLITGFEMIKIILILYTVISQTSLFKYLWIIKNLNMITVIQTHREYVTMASNIRFYPLEINFSLKILTKRI